ncbi:LytR/AlgR family response regulator transcription factor [Daejeonella sp.]|uniref:LytR/AlgR family response regulator transcription factor n=1 Tax=Daejeonella sp. TaxID=2805397 RepID=UPI003983D000
MLNCIAVDDEALALSLLVDNISKVPYLRIVATCRNAFEAIQALQENEVDLIFVDIRMPGLTGLQFIESLSKKPMVIFVTAYKEFAVDGFALEVVDYLLKPVPMERFLKACDRALQLDQLKKEKKAVVEEPDFFFINVDYSLVKIHYKDIVYIQGLKDYVKITLNNSDKSIVPRSTVSGIEKLLPSSKFIRIHKSVIVSKAAVTAIRKNSVFIGETEFSIGDTYGDVIDKLTGKSN